MRSIILSLVMLGFAAAPAFATTFFSYDETCPVGGERFPAMSYGSYSTWGARLDGRPYGSSMFPLEVPICPSNGFVLYKQSSEFTPEQIAMLTPYVDGDYRAIASETSHYRAAQLARVAGEPVATQAWLMLQAAWQTDGDAARSERYQQEFLTLADAALREGSATNTEWWMMQFRAANAERQLSRFDAALARLAALPMDSLASAGNDGQVDANFAENYRSGLTLLRGIIEARDASMEPEAARPRRG